MKSEIIENGDKIFKFLQRCQRDYAKPDLHSFEIKIKDGIAFVECRGGNEVYILAIIYGKEEKHDYWVGTTVAAANRLALLGADYETIEM